MNGLRHDYLKGLSRPNRYNLPRLFSAKKGKSVLKLDDFETNEHIGDVRTE
jgi:hypothetical protein